MSETTNQPCRRDEDCDVDPTTNLCRKCGVEHGDPCPECGGRGYHRDDCETMRPLRWRVALVEYVEADSAGDAVGKAIEAMRRKWVCGEMPYSWLATVEP